MASVASTSVGGAGDRSVARLPCDIGRVALLCGAGGEQTNAILEYTRLLDHALRAQGIASTTVEVMNGKLPDLHPYDTVVLEYNPFLYGRWGFAPQLVTALTRARVSRRRPRIALMAHETYVSITDWRSAVMGGIQRAQLRALHAISDVIFASIETWTQSLACWHPSRPTAHLPVGSNLPDRRDARAATREGIEADDATIVVASFGTSHPSRLLGHTVRAANAVARHCESVVMLNLGAGAPLLQGLDAQIRLVQPGPLPAATTARLLAGADIFVAPFVDGVSTRRGSVMAALQHALPVVGTVGHLTDPSLRECNTMELIASGDVEGFAQAAAELALRPARRAVLAEAAAALYRREFDWPVVATRLREHLLPGRSITPHSSLVELK